jgi:hypothetical protein
MPQAEPRHYSHPLPDASWLARRQEPILQPDLPIVDALHHLWDHAGHDYRLDELLADTGSGHRILATVFAQCGWACRDSGPEEQRPVGETEAVVAVAEGAARRGVATRGCAGHHSGGAVGIGPWEGRRVEDFGAGRCMFGSNVAVDKAMFAYP